MGRLEYGFGQTGGPNWFKNWCVAPVIVEPIQIEFIIRRFTML